MANMTNMVTTILVYVVCCIMLVLLALHIVVTNLDAGPILYLTPILCLLTLLTPKKLILSSLPINLGFVETLPVFWTVLIRS